MTIHVSYRGHVKEIWEYRSSLLFQEGLGCSPVCLSTAAVFTVHIYGISKKRISHRPSVDPASTVVLSVLLFTILLPCLIYFCSPQSPIFACYFFCAVSGVGFSFTQDLSIGFILLFPLYSEWSSSLPFEPFLNDHIHSLLSVHGTYKSGEKPHTVSVAWMCSPSLVNEFRKNKHPSPQVFSLLC